MTRTSFRKQEWTGNMFAVYKNRLYAIGSCDFDNYVVGLVNKESDTIFEVSCRNIEIQKINYSSSASSKSDILRAEISLLRDKSQKDNAWFLDLLHFEMNLLLNSVSSGKLTSKEALLDISEKIKKYQQIHSEIQ